MRERQHDRHDRRGVRVRARDHVGDHEGHGRQRRLDHAQRAADGLCDRRGAALGSLASHHEDHGARRAAQTSTATSGPSAKGGTSSIRSPLQKRPGSYQLGRPAVGQQPHALIRRGHELGAVDVSSVGRAAHAAVEPLAREPERRRERTAVEVRDDAPSGDPRARARSCPRAAASTRAARSGRATSRTAGSSRCSWTPRWRLPVHTSGSELAELGVPEQRREVVERHDHADVVDRAVRHGLDRAVGQRAAAEQPDVTGRGQRDGLGERHCLVLHRP